jgi:hypothetical protein
MSAKELEILTKSPKLTRSDNSFAGFERNNSQLGPNDYSKAILLGFLSNGYRSYMYGLEIIKLFFIDAFYNFRSKSKLLNL